VVELTLTEAEKRHGHLEDARLEVAVRAVREDGFVVLHQAIEPAHIAVLRERMLEDALHIEKLEHVPFQFRTGHLQQDPPPFPPYLFRDVLVNAFAVDITHALLGDGVKNSFYSGNCCLPNDNRQPLHVDIGHLWSGLQKAHPAHALVINVPVVDMTPDNGSTELWPGTHLDTTRAMGDGDIKIPDEVLERVRAEVQPLQPSVPAGSLLIRDMRLWHCGMPNRTQIARPMIAMIHWPRWYNTGSKLQFAKGSEAIFVDERLHTEAEFTDEPIDYIGRNRQYDYAE
jgi:hypothetical protein